MFKIQTLNKISPTGLDKLSHDLYEIASEIIHPDAIIVRSHKMHDMELPESLQAIARAGAGVNNIPIDRCSERGIIVFNTPGANANSVKELVLAGLFLTSRDILGGIAWAQCLAGKGDAVPKLIEKGKSQFVGPEIRGKKFGVIGLGAIGVMVANDAASLGMEVTGYDPFISVESAWGLSRDIKKARGFENLLSESDYISLHVPLDDETHEMINHSRFAIMKKGVRLLNFARGGLVSTADLKEALQKGIVQKYITDFPDEDLLNIEGVICVPHLGASSAEAEENCAIMAATQLKEFLEKGNIRNSVNFPECDMDMRGDRRLVVANRNIPAMVGQITAVLADDRINIVDMLNRSRGDLAYNIIDIDGEISDTSVGKIRKIDGVLMARVIG
jgi:D-3-phosphoglycerate dehydrogenase